MANVNWFIDRFGRHRQLAETLLPHAFPPGNDDGSHDLAHLDRVWGNVQAIVAAEGGDTEILAAAVLLHDCVAVEKNSPLRNQASRLAAEKAISLLTELRWPTDRQQAVAHAIEARSFSAGIEPGTLEARILQDADRLDALGFMGVARCFYTAGRMGSSLYDPADPGGENRPLDDRRYALDHFPRKLLQLAQGFRTRAGQKLAMQRHDRLKAFHDGMLEEVGWTGRP